VPDSHGAADGNTSQRVQRSSSATGMDPARNAVVRAVSAEEQERRSGDFIMDHDIVKTRPTNHVSKHIFGGSWRHHNLREDDLCVVLLAIPHRHIVRFRRPPYISYMTSVVVGTIWAILRPARDDGGAWCFFSEGFLPLAISVIGTSGRLL
jgi:hypothetical protein